MRTRTAISIQEAVKRSTIGVYDLGTECVHIDECDGRVLGEDIVSDHDVPPFNRSPYDGFAIRAEDTFEATEKQPAQLTVIERIGAGELAKRSVGKGEATRIMTGAGIPSKANTVVMLEHVQEKTIGGKPVICIPDIYQTGQNISRKGEETKRGATQVDKREIITPGVKAVLATFGYSQVRVQRKPVVGIYATGSELLDVEEEMIPGKIRNSNAYMIGSLVQESGGKPCYLGTLMDDLDSSFKAIKGALSHVDILITTGGVSVGDYDFLPAIYDELNAQVSFNKVSMRPGGITTVANLKGKPLIGLSGNPAACFVGFRLFAQPIIKKMIGLRRPFAKKTKAVLTQNFLKKSPVTRFVRGKINLDGPTLTVSPVGLDKSNAVTPLAHTDSFIVFPGGSKGSSKGSQVDVLLLNGGESQWTIE